MPQTQEQIREQSRLRTARYRERNRNKPPTEEQRRAHNERNRLYRERHPETIRRIAAESNNKRREARAEWAKKNRQTISEERKAILNARSRIAVRNWAANNREISRERAHNYYWSNRDKILAANKERENQNEAAAYVRGRRQTDPAFRLLSNLRVRLWHALAHKNTSRAGRTMELVGCSIIELREHLERQFDSGMSWDNYGQWHVDHIKPCASFDITDPDQQRICFHYSNLQPLWARDNHVKSYKPTTKEPNSVSAT